MQSEVQHRIRRGTGASGWSRSPFTPSRDDFGDPKRQNSKTSFFKKTYVFYFYSNHLLALKNTFRKIVIVATINEVAEVLYLTVSQKYLKCSSLRLRISFRSKNAFKNYLKTETVFRFIYAPFLSLIKEARNLNELTPIIKSSS